MLSSGSSSSDQLKKWARQLKIPINAIVYKDQLQRLIPRHGAYIINLADSKDSVMPGGSHWVGLYLGRRNIFYFDSFSAPWPQAVSHFVKRYGHHFIYMSNKEIQSLSTGYCGQFVIAFLGHLVRDESLKSYEQFLEDFNLVK